MLLALINPGRLCLSWGLAPVAVIWGSASSVARLIYILFKKALAVERPSLLAVPMKNVASSSFTQSELVELCQWAGGSWGTHPLLCGVQEQV